MALFLLSEMSNVLCLETWNSPDLDSMDVSNESRTVSLQKSDVVFLSTKEKTLEPPIQSCFSREMMCLAFSLVGHVCGAQRVF